MSSGLIETLYNPDVLSCLANLSNDEVFTPPEVVNKMLDMLPQELFSNPDTTFLETASMCGGYMMCIGNHIPWNVPGEAVKRYLELSRELGRR